MTVKLVTEQHMEFLSLQDGCTDFLSLHMSKFHIVGNHMSRLICSRCNKQKTFSGKKILVGLGLNLFAFHHCILHFISGAQ